MTHPLANATIALSIFPILPPCRFVFDATGQLKSLPIPFLSPSDKNPDVTIRFALSDWLSGKNPSLEGDAELAWAFEDWFHAQPDIFEQKCAEYFGDYIAQKTMAVLKTLWQGGADSLHRQQTSWGEFLKETAVVSEEEIDEYVQAVDECRLMADRLEARITLLEQTP